MGTNRPRSGVIDKSIQEKDLRGIEWWMDESGMRVD